MKRGKTKEKKEKHGKKLKKKTKMKNIEKKRAQWGTTPRRQQQLIFDIRALIGNRKALEAKKEDFEHPRKKKKKKEKKGKHNERK